jgi:uncharacterized membrane protein
MKPVQKPSEELLPTERIISAVLRGGVFISGGVILLGLIIYILHGDWRGVSSVTSITFPHSLGAVFGQAAHGSAGAIIMVGLLLLIATPVTRIAVSILTFAVERDWRYVIITSIVLAILLISFTLGKAGG